MLLDLIIRDAVGFPLRWRDPQGVLHAVEGAHSEGGAEGFVIWTRCEGLEIRPEDAWSARQPVTCRHCAQIEHAERLQILAADAIGRSSGVLAFGSHRPGRPGG